MEWVIRNKNKKINILGAEELISRTHTPITLDGKKHLLCWKPNFQAISVISLKDKHSKLKLEKNIRLRSITQPNMKEDCGNQNLHFEIVGSKPRAVSIEIIPASRVDVSTSRLTTTSPKRQLAPLTGRLIKLMIQPGQAIRNGDAVAVIEAMKMQNKIMATVSGVVQKIFVTENIMVNQGEELFSAQTKA